MAGIEKVESSNETWGSVGNLLGGLVSAWERVQVARSNADAARNPTPADATPVPGSSVIYTGMGGRETVVMGGIALIVGVTLAVMWRAVK